MTVGGSSMGAGARPGRPVGVATLPPGICASPGAGLPLIVRGGVWGRPVGIAEMKDGSLLVGEDENGTLWRVVPKP